MAVAIAPRASALTSILEGCHEAGTAAGQAGRGRPRVSVPRGRRARPTRKATEVRATGTPMVWKRATPAPTRKVIPAPANRPTEVAKAKAVARHSVGYCSGSHRV